jgi:hypothetical protein
LIFEVIDAVLVAEFKLRYALSTFIFLAWVELVEVLEIARAVIVAAFVDSKERFLFPEVERVVTVGAPEDRFGLTFVFTDL